MVTQCDWSWYLAVRVITNHLLQQINKDSRVPVWLHPLYSAAQTYNTHRLAVLWGEIITKNQNFCGDESISREIGSTSWNRINIVKSGQHKNEISWNRVNTKTKSREIGSTQKRNLVKSGQHKNEISWNRVNIVKSSQHKNEISWNGVNTKTKSRKIGATRDFRFIMKYANTYL